MKLTYDKHAKDPIFYMQKSSRVNGKSTTVFSQRIGRYSELKQKYPDPIAYAKEYVRLQTEKEKAGLIQTGSVIVDFNKKLAKTDGERISARTSQNIGYFFLKNIYDQLEMKKFFRKITADSRITFDPNLINSFLTFDRILSPGSKLHTVNHLNWYYQAPQFTHTQILRMMDILEDHYDEYISWLFQHSNHVVPRDISCCYYDCTNFFTETECADDDYTDEVTGEVFPGLRQYGASKEHRPQPIVEMGLFMDKQGIPISMCIHPGNENEQTTAVPQEKKILKMLNEDNREFIYIADAGLGSSWIRQFNDMGGRKFIVTQSIKKLSNVLKEAVFNDYDYRLISSNESCSIETLKSFDKEKATEDQEYRKLYEAIAYKVIPCDRLVDLGLTEFHLCKNGKVRQQKAKGTLKQSVIVTFSRKMFEYQRTVRNRQIERAKNKMGKLDPDTFKKGPNDVTRFIRKVPHTEDGSEPAYYFEIDEERIREEEKYDGYYAIATNVEIPQDAEKAIETVRHIRHLNEERYQIEECFRILKTNFSARPIHHQKRPRIIAHFMICYTALLVYRLLEVKVNSSSKIWHCTTNEIIETLRNMEVVLKQNQYYDSIYTASYTLDALNTTFNAGLDKESYLPKTLNQKAKKISN
jgi:transposase